MIKGVNKKVLEINNPDSLYFEKAVLYVKPNMAEESYRCIIAEAENMLRELSPKARRYALWRRAALWGGLVLAGIFIGAGGIFLVMGQGII